MGTDWPKIDLNLLLPLNALLLERNVTKAAERLAVGQPTMSVSLAKLRRYFDDPLLVREGRGLVLTPFAESLRLPVQTALVAAREVLTAAWTFDPEGADRTFTVFASDYVTTLLLHPLMSSVSKTAPGIRITIDASGSDLVESLRSQRYDLLFWPLQVASEELLRFPHLQVLSDEFVAVADQHSGPADSEPLTPEEIASHPAVVVTTPGGKLAIPDFRLREIGRQRNAVVTVGSFGLALQTISGTNLITLTQRRLFQHWGPMLGLRQVPTTDDLPKLSMAMFWNPRSNNSPAHQWLRDSVTHIANSL